MPRSKNEIPTCDSLIQQIDRWFGVLRRCGVDVSSPAEYYFDRCSACRSEGAKKKKKCQGGSLRIDTNNPIRFVARYGGRSITATVTATTQWSDLSFPFPKRHSVEVEVSAEGKQPYRAHLDLAADSRQEPLFHLQAGGFRVEKPEEERHFGLLRWPMIPLDLILATELILYTFQHEEWEAVHQDAEFLYSVRQSEERFLAPFFHLWSNPKDRGHSFLAAFCASRQG